MSTENNTVQDWFDMEGIQKHHVLFFVFKFERMCQNARQIANLKLSSPWSHVVNGKLLRFHFHAAISVCIKLKK